MEIIGLDFVKELGRAKLDPFHPVCHETLLDFLRILLAKPEIGIICCIIMS